MLRAALRLREAESWIAWVRLGGALFVFFQLLVRGEDFPAGYAAPAWATTTAFALGALVLWRLSFRPLRPRGAARLGLAALAFDTAVVSAYVLVYSFDISTPIRMLLFIPVIEGALRYGVVGGVAVPLALAPVYTGFEFLQVDRLPRGEVEVSRITFAFGVLVIAGLVVGWLVRRLGQQTVVAESRAAEAERLRDELGHRVDVLEAANRCARALGSSLELDRAFGAFIRELRGVIPFERTAIVLAEDGTAQVMAAAGAAADAVFPPGTSAPLEGTVLEEVLAGGHVVYREDMSEPRHPEEEEFARLGLRCRLVAPLLAGPSAIGMLSLVRREPRSFSTDEIELASLLGRLVATGVQNIRAYEAERRTVDELRRLSALRADFVSLVSHELRSPMAAVIGASRTLQQRWRQLTPEQRESFLELIAGETGRLAALVGDVLDTSRIEAGTFSYSFSDVDVAELVRETVAAAGVRQEEVRVLGSVHDPLPSVRGDRERLRQVLTNLIDNAVKYSRSGSEVRVRAYGVGGQLHVDVTDFGPGIARDEQGLIFEKFGRATADGAKPGSGLGLFIARSIVEAHGGSLVVQSALQRGSTFTVTLPAEAGAAAPVSAASAS